MRLGNIHNWRENSDWELQRWRLVERITDNEVFNDADEGTRCVDWILFRERIIRVIDEGVQNENENRQS